MKNSPLSLVRNQILQIATLASLLPGIAFLSPGLQANPRGANVVAGSVNFQGMGSSRLDINNLSQKAIINWQSFSIDRGEVTRINQGANAFTLNRVVSGNPTAIHGQLKAARGGVVVVNPNGIVVGSEGTIDVAGMLTLSTLDINNKDFLSGGADRYRGNTEAGVRNYGTISSESGDVVLMGNFLQNAGEVNAPRGVVAFGAGGEIIVDHAGGAKISVQAGASGGATGIDNSGTVNSAAAELKAHGNVYALAIQNDGVVRASGYNFKGGRLTLSAGSGGRIVNTGTLRARNADGTGGRVMISGGQVDINAGSIDASGASGQIGGSVEVAGSGVNIEAGATVTAAGATGGRVSIGSTGTSRINGAVDVTGNFATGGSVRVEGEAISVGSQAVIDASGETGGGQVMVGGGFQGKDATMRNADIVEVGSGSVIIADAEGSGIGGNVILWADGDTLFAGDVSARGIDKGGFAEISGKESLVILGDVDLTATSGTGGTLLLDPTDITITSTGAPGLGGSTLGNLWLSDQLDQGTNVVIATNFGGATQSGNITIGRISSTAEAYGDRVEWYQDSDSIAGGTLTLLAMGNISFNTSVRSAGVGGINIVAGWDGVTGLSGGPGDFDMAAVLATMNDGVSANDAAGVNGGSVMMGSVSNRVGLDVGSRYGDTNLAAADLFVQSGTLTGNTFSQLGFRDSGYEFDFSRELNLQRNEWWGNLGGDSTGAGATSVGSVLGKNYIQLLGGTEFVNGAFRGAGWGATGDITVGLSGRLDMRGGLGNGYTQIGHGSNVGNGFEGHRGDGAVPGFNLITNITTRDGVYMDPVDGRRSFFSSTWRTNYMGDAARIDSDVTVTADGDILMMASRGFDVSGEIAVNRDGNIYTLIGHGGHENQGSFHGDVTVVAHGRTPTGFDRGPQGVGIQILGGRAGGSFAQFGHGSASEGNRRSIWDQSRSGDIVVAATTGGILMEGHNQAVLEGNLNFGTPYRPDQPTSAGNASDSSDTYSHVMIGHGGSNASIQTSGGVFRLPGGTDVTNITPDQSLTGDITVYAGGTYFDYTEADPVKGITVRAGNRGRFHAMIGHGGDQVHADNANDQTPDFGPGANNPNGVAPTLAASTGLQGNLRVEAPLGDIAITGGDSFRADRVWGYGLNYARVGHGGDTVRGPKGGTITVLAGQGAGATDGDILFTAGRMFRSHAQLGHGGYDSAGLIGGPDNSAEIIVTAYGDISFISPESGEKDALGLSPDYANWWFSSSTNQPGYWQTEDRWVMLGHGNRSGVLLMPNRQDITVTSGTGDMANADGDTSSGGITFIAGDMERDYAQLGHGGYAAGANDTNGYTGDITLNANGGGVRFDASAFGAQAFRRNTDRSLDGVTVTPSVVQGFGGGSEAYAQLGHGGYATRGVHTGDITINAWGGLDFLAALAAPRIGRVVTSAPLDAAINAGTNVWVPLANFRTTSATDALAYQMPEIYSNVVPGSLLITLSDGTSITDLANNSSDDRTSGLFRAGVKVGDINYDAGIVRFTGSPLTGTWTGTGASASFDTAQGIKERAFVQLGHGGYESEGPNNMANNLTSMTGDITIGAAGDIRFQAGAAHRAYAQLGHGGWDVKGIKSGDITIDHVDASHLVGGLRFTAGRDAYRQFDYQSFAQLGHGGWDSDGNSFGKIMVRGTQDADGVGLLFKAGDRQDNFVQLGHGGSNSRSGTGDGPNSFGLNGDIDIEVGGHVAFVAGTFSANNPAYDDDGRLYAMLGHGGYNADPSNNDTANFTAVNHSGRPAGTTGAGDGNWGHFGDISLVTTSGDISFMGGSTIPVGMRVDADGNSLAISDSTGLLTSYGNGRGRLHWAQLGHGGILTGGNHHGNITVSTGAGSVHVIGGDSTVDLTVTTKINSAQIGHGSTEAPGNTGGADETIKVFALGGSGNIKLIGGPAGRNGAQIGNGGYNSSGDSEGYIKVIAVNNLIMNGGGAGFTDNMGKIGHGDQRNAGAGMKDGDIHISGGNSLAMGHALIGHVDYRLSPGFFAGFTSGNTYIAVGRNQPEPGGPGSIFMTPNSVITSAGGGTFGELRIYMPDASSNLIADGAYVNATYTRTTAPGTNRPDEHIATEHRFPASGVTEADATFTPEGDYPIHSLGLYNIYYAGEAPPTPEPPAPPAPPTPPGPADPDFGDFFFTDAFDSLDRDDRFLGDGLTGAGDELYYNPGLYEEDEGDEEELRDKQARGKQVPMGATYYVYDPSTNRYSSYRVFGVPGGIIPTVPDPE